MDVEGKTMNTESVLANAVQKTAQGDRAAFRTVFDAANNKVFLYLLGQLHNREEALDVLQDTFIDIWKALPKFHYRSDEEFWGFVFTIARRKVFAFRKHATRAGHVVVDNDRLEVMSEERAGTALAYPEDHHLLLEALAKLSDTSHEILKLRYWSELSFKEIAITIETSENAAKVRHHRALKELQTYLPQTYVEQQFT
jgi:RNA polymerase sigma-70 factor (ECF subfamily)